VRAFALFVLFLLLVPTAAAFHQAPSPDDEVQRSDTGDSVTWRSVAFHPNQTQATLVGAWEDGDTTHSLIAQWTPGTGLEEVYNRSGPALVDVDVRSDGTQVVVGLRDTILYGQPGDYRDVWEESRFADDDRNLTFYGLGTSFSSDDSFALVSGSSLLRVDANGSLEVVHSGEGAFFRSIDFNPASDYALVEAAVQREDDAVLGTVWRTNGYAEMTREDNVAIYGRFQRGDALLNAISFAPNGTFATSAGRDGPGASFMTWSADRLDCHDHENRSECHDHSYRYMGAGKPAGPATCIDWHPEGEYALVTGLEQDVLGYADDRMWAPLVHQGPDLLGCAFAHDGSRALAVGHNGTVVEVTPGEGPLVRVLDPKPGRLAQPGTDQRFLVGVLDRSADPASDVTGHVEANGSVQQAAPSGPWWKLTVNTSDVEDGRHHLVVNASGPAGEASTRFPFLVNTDAFQPGTPEIQAPTGLEGTNRDSDGLFTINWAPVEGPIVYQIEQQRRGESTNATQIIEAGSDANETVRVDGDGTYFFRVRASNSHATGNWSEPVSVEVVLDSDDDGVPDARDPQPHTPNEWGDPDGDGLATDVELEQCSDPYEASSTPTTDDDGDGIPNGIECEQGSDPRDADDPTPQTDGDPEPSDNTTANTTDGDDTQDTPAAGLAVLAAALAGAAVLRRPT
jgi:hypothetical protein